MSKSGSTTPMTLEKDEESLFGKGFALALSLTLFTLLLGAIVAQIAPQLPESIKSIKKLGEVGDFVGGMLNPVISGCTLVVALAVWRLQKIELSETKRELQIQRGQQRFFDLLNIYYRTVDSISSNYVRSVSRLASNPVESLSRGTSPYEEVGSEFISLTGKAALAYKRKGLEAGLGDEHFDDEYPTIDWKATVDRCTRAPLNVEAANSLRQEWKFAQSELLLSHYFRTLLLLLKEAESLLGADEHRRYVALFVAQLSDDELALVAYYLWLDPLGSEMLPMAKQYGLLQNMTTESKKIFLAVLPSPVFEK